MDKHRRDPEMRLILVGNMGCGKTLTADTLLNDNSSISAQMPSRVSEVRHGVSEGRRLRLVETPRWYWSGEHIDANVQRETERSLGLVAPGPHAFLILVPVGQFTEMEGRIPAELERVFGKGALEHSLVLLTCGDYLIGRDQDHYVRVGEPGLNAMVNECGGRWHVINNRRPDDREQVISLLQKVEQLIESSGGCYVPSAIHREGDDRIQRKYSLREESAHSNRSPLTQTTWSKEETWDEAGKKEIIRVRSMGAATGKTVSQQLANGLHSQSWYDDKSGGLTQKRANFKLSKDGALLSQMSDTDGNPNNKNFINTIHYNISTDEPSSTTTSIPSPRTTTTSYSFSSSSPSSGFGSSSSTNYSSSSASGSSTKFSSHSSSSSNAISSSSSTSPTNPSFFSFSSSRDLPSSSQQTDESFSSPSRSFSTSSPSTNASYLSSSTTFSSSPSTKTSSSSFSSISSHATTASFSSVSSGPSDELRLVLLGRTGSGKSAAGNAILGRDEFKVRRDDATGATTQSCVKGTAVIGQKRVVVVDTPDWFGSSCPPERLAAQLSSCMDLCVPGPHAFLLCVPVTLPGRSNLHDLSAIKKSFGTDAVLRHTVVLFTHSDILKDVNIEEYIAAKRPELLELVEKSGDRYHVLNQAKNGGDIKELLDKVEQTVKENGGNPYSRQGQGEVGREKMTQLQRGRGGEDNGDRLHSLREEEEVEQEEKNAKTAMRSAVSSVASVLSSAARFVGKKAGEGAKQVPKMVAGGAVLGGVLGLYVGGPIGGAVGATAGSVAAEYGRRKYNKPKTD